mmetsp:Transcript_83214/g.165197  ORF Transcript_83214/g.165197 Transcript_83214/m.165197 type:complete len:231 (+) Transcript_83214:202-894(+)
MLAVGCVPAIDRCPWLDGVVSDYATMRVHQLQFLKMEEVIMKGRPTLVHKNHVDTCLAILLIQSWDQVLDLPDPALHHVRETSNVNDMPGNACMDWVNLHCSNTVTSLQPGIFIENRTICIALLVCQLDLPTHTARCVAHESTKFSHNFEFGKRPASHGVRQDLRLIISCDLEPLAKPLRELVDFPENPFSSDTVAPSHGLHFMDSCLQVFNQHAKLAVASRKSAAEGHA